MLACVISDASSCDIFLRYLKVSLETLIDLLLVFLVVFVDKLCFSFIRELFHVIGPER